MAEVTPTELDKRQWILYGRAAYEVGRNDVGFRCYRAAGTPRGATMMSLEYDVLQADYRVWLVSGKWPPLSQGMR